MEFKELMDTFAADAGMTEPVAYEDDVCHLDINGQDIGFRFVPEASRLVVWTVICVRPPESGEAFLMQLLRANFMNQGIPDGALSLSDDNVVYAHCALKLPVYDKTEFYDLLQRFMLAVDEWRGMIQLVGQIKPLVEQARAGASAQTAGEVRFDA